MSNNKQSRDPKDGFYLNQCWVSISDNHLYFDQCSIKLEPKVIKVLECLAANRDKVVNKEQLIKSVWQERVVADDSLVRCISVLRKHFKSNQVLGLKIDTVAKKGYRLTLTRVPKDRNVSGKQPSTTSKKHQNLDDKRSFFMKLLFIVGLASIVFFYWFYSDYRATQVDNFSQGNSLDNNLNHNLEQSKNNNLPEYQRTVLLTSSDKERYPQLSADGAWLTYSKSTQHGMAVYVKSLTGLGLQQITNGDFYDHQPTFTADARQIVFARINHAGQCEIRIISLIGGVDKKLADCQSQGVYSMAWSNLNHSLYFIDKSSSIAKGKLNKLDPSTGQLEIIEVTTKSILDSTKTTVLKAKELANSEREHSTLDSLGVDDIAISHDGVSIAATLSPMLGVEDIYVSSLKEPLVWIRLSSDQTKIHGLAFSKDDKGILYSSNQTGTFSLWRASLKQWEPRLIPQGVHNISEISVNSDGKIALERWSESSSIKAIDLNGNATTIVEEKNINWGIVQSPVNDDIVFLSDRTGHSELWLKSNGNLRQLTHFNGPWLMSPSWSMDGKLVAFSSNDFSAERLHLFDFESQTVTDIEETEFSESPHWHPNKLTLFYSKKNNPNLGIWSWDYASKTHTKEIEINAKSIKFSDDGAIYFTKSHQRGIWKIAENKQPQLIISDLELVDSNNWFVNGNSLYYIKRTSKRGPSLQQLDLGSDKQLSNIAIPKFLYFSGLSFDSQTDQIWYSQIESEDADIDLLVPSELE